MKILGSSPWECQDGYDRQEDCCEVLSVRLAAARVLMEGKKRRTGETSREGM